MSDFVHFPWIFYALEAQESASICNGTINEWIENDAKYFFAILSFGFIRKSPHTSFMSSGIRSLLVMSLTWLLIMKVLKPQCSSTSFDKIEWRNIWTIPYNYYLSISLTSSDSDFKAKTFFKIKFFFLSSRLQWDLMNWNKNVFLDELLIGSSGENEKSIFLWLKFWEWTIFANVSFLSIHVFLAYRIIIWKWKFVTYHILHPVRKV